MTDTPAPLSPVALSVVECVRKHVRWPASAAPDEAYGIVDGIVVRASLDASYTDIIADLATRLEAAERENERLNNQLSFRKPS